MLTEVEVRRSHRNIVVVKLGSKVVDFKVTKRTVEELLKLADKPYRVVVTHRFQVPIGSGFGSSGAGALSTALAVNEALKLGLTKVETAKAAHIAEVKYRTGLGDVAGQLVGGLEIRKSPGAPGVGLVEKVPSSEITVVCAPLGIYKTSSMITNPSMKEKINKVGRWALSSFLAQPTPSRFIQLSARFAEEVGFVDAALKKFMAASVEAGALGFSVKKRVAFALVRERDVEEVLKVFDAFLPKTRYFTSRIDPYGARVVEK